MRIVVLLLIVANLALFAYTKLDSVAGGEGWRSEQVDPDKIKILTPQQVAALGPAKIAALADVCAEWGPFATPTVRRRSPTSSRRSSGASSPNARLTPRAHTGSTWVPIPAKARQTGASASCARKA
jgi:hypothetical protein